jgi:hypothetical protein
MTARLIADLGTERLEIPLRHDTLRLGSDARCDLHIDHEEVEPHALTLDYRGNTLLLHNHNPYDIYLDDQVVRSGAWSPWNNKTPLRMTQSITLIYEGDGQVESPVEAVDDAAVAPPASGLTRRQITQLSVIGMCALVGWVLLNQEPPELPETQDTFARLANDIQSSLEARQEKKLTKDVLTLAELRRLLQEAHLSEMRWAKSNPVLPIKAYQRILNLEHIGDAKENNQEGLGELYWRIHQYASRRKTILGQAMQPTS